MTTPSESHAAGDEFGVMRQVEFVLNPAEAVASPDAPVKVVKETVAPGITDFVCDVATGAFGGATVAVIVAFVS